MNICYIGLGSNLQQPKQQLEKAITAIKQLGNINAQSPLYQSEAIGPGEQDDYINAVIELHTKLDADTLLSALQTIENQQGRKRTVRWGERTLDLDILLFNCDVINTENLTVPHPRMTERAFVLYPLLDIAPTLTLPDGRALLSFKSQVAQQKLEKLM